MVKSIWGRWIQSAGKRHSNEENAIGTYALADLSVGDYILNTKVSVTAYEDGNLYRLDGSKQAISITIKALPMVCPVNFKAVTLSR